MKLMLTVCACSFVLAGCSGAKKQLGLERQVPDEFAVVKRAPLALPPSYNLRPPQPGAPRPQEQSTDVQARQAVFGEDAGDAAQTSTFDGETSSESLLLQQAGSNGADPAIRQKIAEEEALQTNSKKPVAEKLLGIVAGDDQSSARVVNAKEEAARIRENIETGRPVSEGETPYIDK